MKSIPIVDVKITSEEKKEITDKITQTKDELEKMDQSQLIRWLEENFYQGKWQFSPEHNAYYKQELRAIKGISFEELPFGSFSSMRKYKEYIK
jgi:hypothetical protein